LRQTRSGARNAHASRSDDLSFARYQGRSLAADERLRPFLRDSGKREERRVYALDRLDASVFTTGRFTREPTNTIWLSNVLQVSSFWADQKRKDQRGPGESLPALPRTRNAAFIPSLKDRALNGALGTQFPA
jgi:hypothetical protein